MFSRLIPGWGKKPSRQYPTVRDMLVIFFSNQHDDFGNTIEEIISSYKDHGMEYPQAAKEVSLLLLIKKDEELQKVMTELAEGQFQPEAWNQTWRSFLQKIQLLLSS